nr:ATP-binding protein [Sphingomonas jejuensis]
MQRFGLIGRLVAILLVTLVVEFGVSTYLYERATEFSVRDDEARRLAEHLVISRRIVTEASPAERQAMSRELTTDRYLVRWSDAAPTIPATGAEPDRMRAQILAWEPSLDRTGLRVALLSPGGASVIAGALRLEDSSWLYFRTLDPVRRVGFAYERVLATLLPALVLMVLGGILIRQTLQPVRALTRAVERFGPSLDKSLPHVEEAGTGDVRRLISAFNAMQARIGRLIDERMVALAAVSHDLRTPMARLRLRADAIGDDGLRSEVEADLAGMEAMVTSLLAYLGGEGDPETPRLIDVAVLCASVIDDASDHGFPAVYQGPPHVERMLRPSSFRRAIVNLVENATHYGGSVTLRLRHADGETRIEIDDEGPGIPEESLAAVLEPFVRLDRARQRDTAGFGLGLSIVVKAVSDDGGQFTLANRAEGGLRATIVLPAA